MAGKRKRSTKSTKFVQSKKMKTVAKVARRVAMSTKETHKNTDTINENGINSISATPNVYQNAFLLSQGDAYTMRTGHKIKGVGIKLRSFFHNNGTSPIWVRYLVLVNRRGTADTDFNTGVALFEDNAGNKDFSAVAGNLKLVSRINKEKYTVLMDRVFKLSGLEEGDRTKQIRKWIPYKATLQYDGSASTAPFLNQPVVLAFCGRADTDESTGVTVEHTGTIDFYFKDL